MSIKFVASLQKLTSKDGNDFIVTIVLLLLLANTCNAIKTPQQQHNILINNDDDDSHQVNHNYGELGGRIARKTLLRTLGTTAEASFNSNSNGDENEHANHNTIRNIISNNNKSTSQSVLQKAANPTSQATPDELQSAPSLATVLGTGEQQQHYNAAAAQTTNINRKNINSTSYAHSLVFNSNNATASRCRKYRRSYGEEEESANKQATIFGLRCDAEREISDDGFIIIKSDHEHRLKLFGNNLNANISFALTKQEGLPNDDCTNLDRKSLVSENIDKHIAEVDVHVSIYPNSSETFYFCLQQPTKGWFHQGTLIKIHVHRDLLPLWAKLLVIAMLLGLSGLFSGLNLGLMSLDKNELAVIISSGTEKEKRHAKIIEPVRRRGNYLLCSILFSNVLVNSTIAVLLEELTSGIVAVMTSTIFIVMFGEILPQAFCSRHGLAVGANTVYLTNLCMVLTWPLSFPVSYCLDWALGEEIGHVYDRERLMEFIKITQDYTNLKADEINMISGALKLKRVAIAEIMTKIEDVYMIDSNACLDFDTIQAIIERGYSRIPVYEPGNRKNIIALLFAKDLALLDPDDKTPVQSMTNFYFHPLMFVFEDTTLDVALNEFKTGKSHIAIVQKVVDEGDRDPVYETTGIVTLEDVIEEILQLEINDETDMLTDNRRKRRRKDAQVRKDFSQFTSLGSGDSSHNVVTPQLCLAAYQYLATTVEPFTARYLSDSILKRLLSQKIYYKVKMDDKQTQRRLYTQGEPSDYFIMILEGRVHVVCGRENLVFDSGPFSFFGKAALTASDSILMTDAAPSRKESSIVKPTITRRESVVERMGSNLSISMRKLEQLVSNEMIDNNNTVNIPLVTTSNTTNIASSSMAWLKSGESKTSVHSVNYADRLASHYMPDYTVEIVSNTSYLKVTRNDYLTAVKATLVERGNSSVDFDGNTTASSTANIDNEGSQMAVDAQGLSDSSFVEK